MTTASATTPSAGDLRTTPPGTCGQRPEEDPGTDGPQVETATLCGTITGSGGSGGRNQYGDLAHEDHPHKDTLDRFLNFVRLNRSEATATCYKARLRPLLRWWGDLPPSQWTNTAFEEYIATAKEGRLPGQIHKAGVRSVQLLLIAGRATSTGSGTRGRRS